MSEGKHQGYIWKVLVRQENHPKVTVPEPIFLLVCINQILFWFLCRQQYGQKLTSIHACIYCKKFFSCYCLKCFCCYINYSLKILIHFPNNVFVALVYALVMLWYIWYIWSFTRESLDVQKSLHEADSGGAMGTGGSRTPFFCNHFFFFFFFLQSLLRITNCVIRNWTDH